MPAPQVSPENVGAPIARAVGALGQIVQEEREKVADIQTNEALVRLRSARDAALYDPKDGALVTQRANALDAPEKFGARWQQDVSAIEASIKDPEARRRFRMKAEQERVEAESMVLRHVDTETERLDADTTRMRAEALASDAVALAGAPEAEAKVAEREALVRARLTRQGIVGEAQDAALAQDRSKVRLGQIDALVRRDATDAAEALLKRVEGDLRGTDLAAAKTLVEESSLLTRSQQASDNLFAAFGPDGERAALAKARGQFEGKMREQVIQQLERRYADERRLRVEAINQRTTDALGVVESGRSLSASERAWFVQNNPQALRSLDARATQIANGTPPETVWSKYDELQDIFATGDAIKIRDVDMSAYRPYLENRHYELFSNARRAFLAGQQRALEKPLTDGALTQDALRMAVADGVLSAGITRPSEVKTPEDKRRWQGIVTAIEERLAAAQAAKTDGVLTGPEQMAEVRAVLDDVVIRPSLFGGGQVLPRAAVPEGQRTDTLTTAQRQTFAEQRAARRQRAGLAVVPPMTPGMSRRERYLQLVQAGMTAADAEAMVLREMPEPPQ